MKLKIWRISLLFVCSGGFGLWGCASHLPRTQDLTGHELAAQKKIFASLVNRNCDPAVDADIRLSWKQYSQLRHYEATLLAASPAFIRIEIVDPLQRPQILFVSDSRNFTLVNKLKGSAYRGRLDSTFVNKFLPPEIHQNLFCWLSGQLANDEIRITTIGREEEKSGIWYEFTYNEEDLIHLALFQQGLLQRHIVLNQERTIIFDARYEEYLPTKSQCQWPASVSFSGSELVVPVTLDFSKFYTFDRPAQDLFTLEIPASYSVKQVE